MNQLDRPRRDRLPGLDLSATSPNDKGISAQGQRVPSRRQLTRAVLASGILAGLFQAVTLPQLQPEQVGLATTVYHHAAVTLLEGGNPYASSPPSLPGYAFLYQPIVLAVMLVYGAIGQLGTIVVQSLLNLVSTGLLALLILQTIDRGETELRRIDRTLVVGFVFLSVGSVTNVINGQVNPQLALGIAAGAVLLAENRDRVAGVVFGLLATVKLFPVLVGVWLLRLRAWQAIGAAVLTGVGAFALGAVALGPELTIYYVTEALPSEASTVTFVGGPSPRAPQMTIRRQLAFLLPAASSELLVAIGAAILLPVVLAASLGVETLRQRLVALEATWLSAIVLFPFEPFYLSLALFPTIPLLYLLEESPGWRPFLGGAFVAFHPITLTTVTVWVDSLPLGSAVSSAVLSFAETTFAFALPPTYGVWLILAGCVIYQRRSTERPSRRGGANNPH